MFLRENQQDEGLHTRKTVERQRLQESGDIEDYTNGTNRRNRHFNQLNSWLKGGKAAVSKTLRRTSFELKWATNKG